MSGAAHLNKVFSVCRPTKPFAERVQKLEQKELWDLHVFENLDQVLQVTAASLDQVFPDERTALQNLKGRWVSLAKAPDREAVEEGKKSLHQLGGFPELSRSIYFS